MRNTGYEHGIKRDNGDKIIINVEYDDYNGFHILGIGVIAKGKRKIVYTDFSNDYKYRSLDMTGRKKYLLNKYLELVTVSEIKDAINKCYEQMKPDINDQNLYTTVR